MDATPSSLPARTTAGEFRIVGTPKSFEGAAAAVGAAVTLANGVPVTGFSLSDLLALDAGPLRDVCARLRAAGLDGVAEVPIDLTTDPASAVREAREAGLEVLRVTTHAVLPGQRVETSVRARDLQRAVGGLQCVRTAAARDVAGAPHAGYDDVKLIARRGCW